MLVLQNLKRNKTAGYKTVCAAQSYLPARKREKDYKEKGQNVDRVCLSVEQVMFKDSHPPPIYTLLL